MSFQLQNCRIDSLFSTLGFPLDVLRLDLIHPVISGNKWFKLKGYLGQAKEENKDALLTWGGAYSNHIVASAYAAKLAGLKSIGIIRGEEPRTWSHTLLAAKAYGMQLCFLSREEYRQKSLPQEIIETIDCDEVIEIPEGGYGEKGAEGASEILTLIAPSNYTHIVSAVGTGTTLAGLCLSALDQQRTIGIPVLKNAVSLQQEIEGLLPVEKQKMFQLINGYHFGGYAKHNPDLIQFMNDFYLKTGIPTDFVYTAKAFYATMDLFKNDFFAKGSKVLLLHSGGLQGNFSLPKGTLIFGETKC